MHTYILHSHIYVCVRVFLKIKEKCAVSQASIDSLVVCQYPHFFPPKVIPLIFPPTATILGLLEYTG